MGQVPAVVVLPVIFVILGYTVNYLPSDDSDVVISTFLAKGAIAFGLGFMGMMAGYVLSADVSSDATAWWIHLATGVRGWQDRLGRVLAQSVWMAPLIVIVGVAVMWVMGMPARIPGALAAMVTLYLSGLGVSSVFSALIIYPVALPGESPLKMKTGMMGSQMLSQFGCMLVAGLLGLPICVWAIFASGPVTWLILVIGVVWGMGLLVAGIVLGGKVMDSRGPAILQTLKKNDSRERA